MKKKIFLSAMSALTAIGVQAQSGHFTDKVKNKLNQKVTQRVDNRVNKTPDDGLDVVEGKKSVETTQNNSAAGATAAPATVRRRKFGEVGTL